MDKNRNEFMDIAKGIAILSVIISHCGEGIVHDFLYIFHVPVFFIISGYFFKEYDLSTFIKKKVKGYLIPYLSFGLLLTLLFWISDIATYQSFSFRYFIDELLAIVIIQIRNTTLWYMAALICSTIIFYILVRISPNDIVLFILASICSISFILYDTYISIPLPWNLDVGFIAQIYLVFGYLSRKHSLITRLINSKHYVLIINLFILIGVVLSIINYKITNTKFEMFNSSYGLFPLTISASILGSLAVIIISAHIHSKGLQTLGRNSITYFALHQSLGLIVGQAVVGYIPQTTLIMRVISYLILFGIAMLICYLMDKLIRNTKLKFMVGL